MSDGSGRMRCLPPFRRGTNTSPNHAAHPPSWHQYALPLGDGLRQLAQKVLIIIDSRQLFPCGLGLIGLQVEIGRRGDNQVHATRINVIEVASICTSHQVRGLIERFGPSILAPPHIGGKQYVNRSRLVILLRQFWPLPGRFTSAAGLVTINLRRAALTPEAPRFVGSTISILYVH